VQQPQQQIVRGKKKRATTNPYMTHKGTKKNEGKNGLKKGSKGKKKP
jgi:hypothetical protein